MNRSPNFCKVNNHAISPVENSVKPVLYFGKEAIRRGGNHEDHIGRVSRYSCYPPKDTAWVSRNVRRRPFLRRTVLGPTEYGGSPGPFTTGRLWASLGVPLAKRLAV